MLDILHMVDHQQPRSILYMKDIKGLNVAKTQPKRHRHACNHTENESFKLCDVKQIAHLRRQIQRTGLVLARHAEENAIEKYHSTIGIRGRKAIARRKLHVCVIRINSAGNITESKPCTHCVEVMRSYGIRKVTYSTRDGTLVTEPLVTIATQPSVGYRSVDRAINVLDKMLVAYDPVGIG